MRRISINDDQLTNHPGSVIELPGRNCACVFGHYVAAKDVPKLRDWLNEFIAKREESE